MPSTLQPVLLLFLSVFVNFACMREESSLSHTANLDFVMEADSTMRGWMPGVHRIFMHAKADSSETRNGKPSLKIEPLNSARAQARFKVPAPLIANLQQRFLIPRVEADSATLFFTGKSRGLKTAELIVSGVDSMEERLYSRTLSCLSPGAWQTRSMTIPLKNVAFLHVELKANGPDSNAAWWLDNISLSAEGQNMGELPAFAGHEKVSLSPSEILPLSFDQSEPYAGIPELASKKLLALGESVHGSATVNRSAFQLIKHQVVANNARLILMEMPLAQLISYNRFIQGDEDFQIDSLLFDFHSLISADLLTDLLFWLKEYNKTTPDKVWLMGMDIDGSSMNSAMWLFDYVYNLHRRRPHPVLKSLCNRLITQTRFEGAGQLLQEAGELKALLGEKEYRILEYCLDINTRLSTSRRDRFPARDSVMFENSRFLVNLLAPERKKAVFFCHLGHSNYKTGATGIFSRSFGSYMKEEFGEDYSTIGILTGTGSVFVRRNDSLQVAALPQASPYSMEYLLNDLDEPYLYMPAARGFAQIREMGMIYIPDHFNTISLSARMDGIIFVRDSHPLEGVWARENSRYLEHFSILKFQRNFERNKTLR